MKRKLSLLLAMVLAMTMVMGMSMTALAYAGPPEGCPERVNSCTHPEANRDMWLLYVYEIPDDETVKAACYDCDGSYLAPCTNPVSHFGDPPTLGKVYHMKSDGRYYLCEDPSPTPTPKKSESAHVHNFKWQTITAPTKETDGLEGELCSCGAVRNTQPLSAYGYALNEYATPMINAAKSSQTITFEFGEWNSFPKSFMAKLVDKSAQNVTFVFHYKWNHVKQEITIPAGTPIDLNFDWNGPAKMAELYGAN